MLIERTLGYAFFYIGKDFIYFIRYIFFKEKSNLNPPPIRLLTLILPP